MIMKKILCYMISSVFLLAVLNSCSSDDGGGKGGDLFGGLNDLGNQLGDLANDLGLNAPTLADLEGNYKGNSDLDLERSAYACVI